MCECAMQANGDDGVAKAVASPTGPVSADQDASSHGTEDEEGVTPAGPAFSGPAPCLLPESHQASSAP